MWPRPLVGHSCGLIQIGNRGNPRIYEIAADEGYGLARRANQLASFATCLSSPVRKNISVFPKRKSALYPSAIPSRKRGVGHRHERWGGDAVDADGAKDEAPDADGEVVWS